MKKYLECSLFYFLHLVFGIGFWIVFLLANSIKLFGNIFSLEILENDFWAYVVLIFILIIYITLKCFIFYILNSLPDKFPYVNIILNKFLNDKKYRNKYLITIIVYDIAVFLIGTMIFICNSKFYNLLFNYFTILFFQTILLGGITTSYILFMLKLTRK